MQENSVREKPYSGRQILRSVCHYKHIYVSIRLQQKSNQSGFTFSQMNN